MIEFEDSELDNITQKEAIALFSKGLAALAANALQGYEVNVADLSLTSVTENCFSFSCHIYRRPK